MNSKKIFCYNLKGSSLILALVMFSFLTIGGCNDNNSSNDIGATDTSCAAPSQICAPFEVNAGNLTVTCVLSTNGCKLDMNELLTQITGFNVTEDTIMWIEAWGGNGGSAWQSGGSGGYAVTTTTIKDVESKNGGSPVIYYFLGENGGGSSSGSHCGGAGGSATILTTEDLVMNPSADPTQSAPPVLLVAGGGSGACNENGAGFCGTTSCVTDPNKGGTAIATMSEDGLGAGENQTDGSEVLTMGGNLMGMGSGGASACIECGGGNETSGTDGYGGRGGSGGSGSGCSGPGSPDFRNVPTTLSFTAGAGGKGSSNQSSCDSGGGGGGGGYGGGGGHGNSNGEAISGAGGGSFAIQSTQSIDISPTTAQDNPCSSGGCIRLTFMPPDILNDI